MSMFVRLLQTPDARYVIGAMVSWLVYGALYIAILNVVTHYAVASGISWILSYGVVYAFQKYGTFGAMITCATRRAPDMAALRDHLPRCGSLSGAGTKAGRAVLLADC